MRGRHEWKRFLKILSFLIFAERTISSTKHGPHEENRKAEKGQAHKATEHEIPPGHADLRTGIGMIGVVENADFALFRRDT